jgi:hypothetical protein
VGTDQRPAGERPLATRQNPSTDPAREFTPLGASPAGSSTESTKESTRSRSASSGTGQTHTAHSLSHLLAPVTASKEAVCRTDKHGRFAVKSPVPQRDPAHRIADLIAKRFQPPRPRPRRFQAADRKTNWRRRSNRTPARTVHSPIVPRRKGAARLGTAAANCPSTCRNAGLRQARRTSPRPSGCMIAGHQREPASRAGQFACFIQICPAPDPVISVIAGHRACKGDRRFHLCLLGRGAYRA